MFIYKKPVFHWCARLKKRNHKHKCAPTDYEPKSETTQGKCFLIHQMWWKSNHKPIREISWRSINIKAEQQPSSRLKSTRDSSSEHFPVAHCTFSNDHSFVSLTASQANLRATIRLRRDGEECLTKPRKLCENKKTWVCEERHWSDVSPGKTKI